MDGKQQKKTVRDEFAEKFISILESDKPLEWTQGFKAQFQAQCHISKSHTLTSQLCWVPFTRGSVYTSKSV